MKPYYDHDGITIYHARCEDVLPSIDPADVGLLLTDPPYGISHRSSQYWGNEVMDGDNEPFDPTPLLRFARCVLFGANHYASKLPDSRGWIVWNKRDRTKRTLPGSDVEMAWTNFVRDCRLFTKVWMPHTIRGEPLLHPTQKPVSLMRWIVEQWTEPGDLVLDPYMGSGPVAQACHELGRSYIGIELVEEYCAIAVKRLSQQTLDLAGGNA